MRDDHPPARDVGRDLGSAVGDIFVGQAVEAVAAHALRVERLRDGEWSATRAVAAVEGGVEAGDLRQLRPARAGWPGSARDCAAGAAAPAGRSARARASTPSSIRTGRHSPGRHGRPGGPTATSVDAAAFSPQPCAGRLQPSRPRSRTSLRRIGCDRSARRHRAARAQRGRVPMPSIWPLSEPAMQRRPSTSKTWNLMLDEPALTTRIASMQSRRRQVAVPRAARARRARRPRRRPCGSRTESARLVKTIGTRAPSTMPGRVGLGQEGQLLGQHVAGLEVGDDQDVRPARDRGLDALDPAPPRGRWRCRRPAARRAGRR